MQRLRPYITRHEPRQEVLIHLKSVAGAVVGVMMVGGLSAWTGQPFLIASLGPTALLLFSQPESPASQPVNLFAGYLIGVLVACVVETVLPGSWWAASLGVGVVMAAMLLLRVTHPPAAAIPLVTLTAPIAPERLMLLMLAGCVVLFMVAMIHHKLPPRAIYPRRPEIL